MTVPVTINIIDLNDNGPVCTTSYSRSIEETVTGPFPTPVTISCTDADVNTAGFQVGHLLEDHLKHPRTATSFSGEDLRF